MIFFLIQSGVAVESENDFRVDLHCTNPGQTTVQLRVEIADHRYRQAHSLALLEDDVTFEVSCHLAIHEQLPLLIAKVDDQQRTSIQESPVVLSQLLEREG